MRRMKDSGIAWLGEVPEEWGRKKLKYVARIYNGNSISDSLKDNYTVKTDIPYIATKDVDLTFCTANYENGLYVRENSGFKIAPAGSTLLCIEGGSAGKKKAYLDRQVAFVNKLCAFVPLDTAALNGRFLFYYLCSPIFKVQFERNIAGLIGGVRLSTIRNFYIPLPPRKEQDAIARYLDEKTAKIDRLLDARRKEVAALKELKQAVVARAVTCGLEPGAPMKDSGIAWIGEIPEHWGVVRLNQVCHEKRVKNTENIDAPVLSLSYGHIVRKKDPLSGLVTSDFSTYQIVEEGDIILRFTDLQNDHNSLRTGLVTQRGIITSAYKCIVPEGISNAFLHYVLHAYDCLKVFYGMGGGVRQSIGYKDIRHMPIVLPPREEQDAIARYLDEKTAKIDKIAAAYTKEIALLEELKTAVIADGVRGNLVLSAVR